MHTFVFIHGTGVREPAYTASFSLVQQTLNRLLGAAKVRVEPCYWGGDCGSDLFLKGVSIPEFDATRAIEEEGAEDDEAEYPLALWALLYDDPFGELDLLVLRASEETAPGEPLSAELDDTAKNLRLETAALPEAGRLELRTLLTGAGLADQFDRARADVVAHPSYVEAIGADIEPLTDYRFAIARAMLARSLQRQAQQENLPEGYVMLDGSTRDRIVQLLVAALGGEEKGVLGWVKKKAGRLIRRIGTRRFKRRRGRASEQFAPLGADVIVYQTRPAPIRKYLREAVTRANDAARARGESGDVILLAHSLGGIAAVDSLIEQPLPCVRHLVTVGSQAPLLYELDALGSMPLRRNRDGKVLPAPHALPNHFPRSWLNVYDLRDFLSYRGEGVFGKDAVTDVEVDNGQPFPESHSAYWSNKKIWDAIVHRVTDCSS